MINIAKRNINLEEYGINENLYKELHGFCLQYNEKKAKLNSLYGLRSTSFVKVSDGFHFSDPTERTAELAEKYRNDIELIERTAREVDEYCAPFIIKNVTEDVPVWALKTTYDMKTGETQFRQKRKRFYYLLAVHKNCV